MKRLDLYILKELFVPFLIGTIAVVLMFQANMVIFLFKSFSAKSIPIAALLQILLYRTPEFLNMTLPVGVSLAVSLAISRLARESELTALRSAGASIFRVLRGVIIFGILVAVLNYLVVEELMPRSTIRARKVEQELSMASLAPDLVSNVTIKFQSYTANIGTVTRSANGGIQLNDVVLFERPRSNDEVWIYSAKNGTYQDGIWTLANTKIRVIRGDDTLLLKPGKDVVIHEPITVPDLFVQPAPLELSQTEIRNAIRDGKKIGRDTRALEIQYHTRFSVPAACVVFAFAAPLFAIGLTKMGAFVGVLISIFNVFLYFNLYVISTEILGRNGWVSPWLAAWLPNFLFIGLGILGLRRLE